MTAVIGWPAAGTITWSIDTTGLRRPQAARSLAREAFDAWAATGHTFQRIPTGGQIAIVFRAAAMPEEWGAYGQWTRVVECASGWCITSGVVVIDRRTANSDREWLKGALAHEIGHALGLPHLGPGTVMGSPSLTGGRVTRADIAAERALQRPTT